MHLCREVNDFLEHFTVFSNNLYTFLWSVAGTSWPGLEKVPIMPTYVTDLPVDISCVICVRRASHDSKRSRDARLLLVFLFINVIADQLR